MKLYASVIILLLLATAFNPISAIDVDTSINGSKIQLDNSNIFISANPHTIYSSGWVEYSIISKSYSGRVNIQLGFSGSMTPTKIELYGNHSHTVTTSKLIEKGVPPDFTQKDPGGKDSVSELVTTTYYHVGWYPIDNKFEKQEKELRGAANWYTVSGISMQNAKETRVRVFIDIPFSKTRISGEYFFAVEEADSTQKTLNILDPWYDVDWIYKKTITIDHDYVTDELVDFPILIKTTDTDLAAEAQDDGDDILFTNDAEEKIPHEIESFDGTSGALVAWVKTDIASDADTVIYMYYGNSGASNQQDVVNVWNANYLAVYHLSEASGTIYDSTSNNNDGTGSGIDYGTTAIAGKGITFSSGDYVDLGTGITMEGKVQTLEAWQKSNGLADGYIIGRQWRYYLPITADQYAQTGFQDAGGYHYPVGNDDISDNAWHYQAGTHDGDNAATGTKLYTEGVIEATAAASGNLVSSAESTYLGRSDSSGGSPFVGVLDEVRISNTNRSAAWLNATYQTITNYSTFTSIGAETTNIITVTGITTVIVTVSTSSSATSTVTPATSTQISTVSGGTSTTTVTTLTTSNTVSYLKSVVITSTVSQLNSITEPAAGTLTGYETTSITSSTTTTTSNTSTFTTASTTTTQTATSQTVSFTSAGVIQPFLDKFTFIATSTTAEMCSTATLTFRIEASTRTTMWTIITPLGQTSTATACLTSVLFYGSSTTICATASMTAADTATSKITYAQYAFIATYTYTSALCSTYLATVASSTTISTTITSISTDLTTTTTCKTETNKETEMTTQTSCSTISSTASTTETTATTTCTTMTGYESSTSTTQVTTATISGTSTNTSITTCATQYTSTSIVGVVGGGWNILVVIVILFAAIIVAVMVKRQ